MGEAFPLAVAIPKKPEESLSKKVQDILMLSAKRGCHNGGTDKEIPPKNTNAFRRDLNFGCLFRFEPTAPYAFSLEIRFSRRAVSSRT